MSKNNIYTTHKPYSTVFQDTFIIHNTQNRIEVLHRKAPNETLNSKNGVNRNGPTINEQKTSQHQINTYSNIIKAKKP